MILLSGTTVKDTGVSGKNMIRRDDSKIKLLLIPIAPIAQGSASEVETDYLSLFFPERFCITQQFSNNLRVGIGSIKSDELALGVVQEAGSLIQNAEDKM